MEIIAGAISKSYSGISVIQDFSHIFREGSITGISGPNGSGKSTLVKMLSGYLTPGQGKIIYQIQGNVVRREQVFRHISLAAPYSVIIKDFSLKENFELLLKFKPIIAPLTYRDLLAALEWKNPGDKKVAQFSSGMIQKVNLFFAMICQTELLLLDEPTSYLDQANKAWYHALAERYFQGRTVIVASNDEGDFQEVGHIIRLTSL